VARDAKPEGYESLRQAVTSFAPASQVYELTSLQLATRRSEVEQAVVPQLQESDAAQQMVYFAAQLTSKKLCFAKG
jgi:hypothetical protein